MRTHHANAFPAGGSGPRKLYHRRWPPGRTHRPGSGILIVEDERGQPIGAPSGARLRKGGNRSGLCRSSADALTELSSGGWSLVIVNIEMTADGRSSLSDAKGIGVGTGNRRRQSSCSSSFPRAGSRHAGEAQADHSRRTTSHTCLSSFQFSDFLEKVSDLLMETGILTDPMRHVRHDTTASERKRKGLQRTRDQLVRHSPGPPRHKICSPSMKPMCMTEEEIADYEKSESVRKQSQKRRQPENESVLNPRLHSRWSPASPRSAGNRILTATSNSSPPAISRNKCADIPVQRNRRILVQSAGIVRRAVQKRIDTQEIPTMPHGRQ